MFVVSSWFLRLIVLPLAVAIGVFVLPAAASAAAKPGDTEIEARWTALGRESGPLGAKLPPPRNNPYDVPGGRAQDFANGSIFWSEDTGAWDVRGATAPSTATSLPAVPAARSPSRPPRPSRPVFPTPSSRCSPAAASTGRPRPGRTRCRAQC